MKAGNCISVFLIIIVIQIFINLGFVLGFNKSKMPSHVPFCPESSHSYSSKSPPVEALYGFRFEAEFFQEYIHFLLLEILESSLVFNLNFIV